MRAGSRAMSNQPHGSESRHNHRKAVARKQFRGPRHIAFPDNDKWSRVRRLRLRAWRAQVTPSVGLLLLLFCLTVWSPGVLVYVCVRSFMYTLVKHSRLKLQLYRAAPHHTHTDRDGVAAFFECNGSEAFTIQEPFGSARYVINPPRASGS